MSLRGPGREGLRGAIPGDSSPRSYGEGPRGGPILASVLCMRSLSVVLVGVLAAGAVAQDPVVDEAQAVLGLASRHRKPEARVHYLLSRGQDSELRRRAVGLILGREAGLDELLLSAARKEKRGANRRLALLSLLGRDVELAVILEIAVADRDKSVLPAVAARIAEEGQGAEAVRILAPGLQAKKSVERLRAARALGEIGDESALEPLRAALEARRCACTRRRGARAHGAFLTQTSHVRSFSTEIA